MDVDFIVEREEMVELPPPVELTGWETVVFVVEDVEPAETSAPGLMV